MERAQPLVEAIEAPIGVGSVATFAGQGPPSLPGNVDHSTAGLGRFSDPAGIASGLSNVFVADWGNNAIRVMAGGLSPALTTLVTGRPNLLINPRAEDTSEPSGLSGWTTQSGAWQPLSRGSQCSNDICGHPYDGTYWFWGGAVADAVLTQRVVVAGEPTVAAGTQRYHFSALVRGNTEDQARVVLDCLKSNGTTCGVLYDSGWVNPATWTPFAADVLAPTNTHRLRVRLETHATNGSSADAYFDAVQLRALRPTGAPSSDLDKELLGPAAIGVLGGGSGNLLVGGEGLWTVAQGTGAVAKVTGVNGYQPPVRVSSISVVGTTNRAYVADPTDPLLHVRSQSGKGYRVEVTGEPNGEPIAVAAKPFDSSNDLVWVSFRGYPKVYLMKCPVPAGTSDTTTVTTCTYQNVALGHTNGFIDDMDGAAGSERFRQGIYGLAIGLNGDLLIAEDYNSAIRRNAGAYTLTIGGGTRGYADGARTAAQFSGPTGIAVLPGTGDVLVADRNNNVIRKIGCGASPVCGGSIGGCPTYPIDDQIPCTGDFCEGLAIRHTPLAAGAACSDLNACNGVETCTATGVCQPGTPLVVDDSKACSADACDPIAGVTHVALAQGTPCTNADACRALSSCNGTSLDCPLGALLPTDDANDCTTDACGAPGGITHTPRPSGVGCRTSVGLAFNDGTCNVAGACIGANTGSSAVLDRTVSTSPDTLFGGVLASGGSGGLQGVGSATSCINTGASPTCVFVPSHLALVRGTVEDASGVGISGATISVVNHPEFGTTTTYVNGEYILLVNGGGPLTIRAAANNKLPSDRLVDPPWGGTDFAADIVLVGLDPKVTAVDFATGGLATGTPTPANAEGDTSPTRTAAVYFPPGTAVTADSGTITAARFRVTEYTVGSAGVARMPADIATNTMYTYAAEFSLEDAAGHVYEHVNFGSPVVSYVDNFLGLNPGEIVPVGYYDREAALWKPMPDGRVIAVDSAGAVTGISASEISPSELAVLAAYKGKSVWRLPIAHFSPLDFNLGLGLPLCDVNAQGVVIACPQAVASRLKGGDDGPDCGSCTKSGSIIDVERQVLRETFPLVGTPFHLAYSSENTLGYGPNKTLSLNIEDHPKHSRLEEYTISFVAAGRRVAVDSLSKLPDGTWPKSFEATWDGLDYQGRPVQGAAVATLEVGAVYPAVVAGVTTFGGPRRDGTVVSLSLGGLRESPKATISTQYTQRLQVWDSSALGFGGWSISSHHALDPVGQVVYFGDGTHRKLDNLGGGAISLVAGSGVAGSSPNGTSAVDASFKEIQALAVDRDGNIFLAIPSSRVVRKLSVVDGILSTVADYAGVLDGPPAVNTPDNPGGTVALSNVLAEPNAIALRDDGRLLIADKSRRRVFEVSRDGRIRTIAGRGDGTMVAGCGVFVDGTDATSVDLCNVWTVAAGPDGSVYFLDQRNGSADTLVRVDQAGRAWLLAGKAGGSPMTTPNKLASDLTISKGGLTVDSTNTVWLSTSWGLLAIPPSGVARYLPQPRRALDSDNAMDAAAFPNGDILRPVTIGGQGTAVDRCTAAGTCSLIAGSSVLGNTSLGSAAVGATFNRIDASATGPDGSVYLADAVVAGSASQGWRVYRVAPPTPRTTANEDCVYKTPAADRSEYYCFEKSGRHRSTVDARTNGTIRTFDYFLTGPSAGLLKKITEADGRITEIDRSINGSVKIKAPTLQTTTITLDSTKQVYAAAISGDGTILPTHDINNGLLRSLQDADGQLHSFQYDSRGRLQRDADPLGYQLLSRTDSAAGYTVSVATTMGRRDSFSREILSDGAESRVVKLPNGLTNTTVRDLGANASSNLADGTMLVSSVGSDPVWGFLAPFTRKSTVSLPAASLTQTTTTARTLQSDGSSFTDTITAVGQTTRTYTRVYDNAAKTIELTSPLGRTTKYSLDTQGRVVAAEYPGFQQVEFVINATSGRVEKIRQGSRETNLTYALTGSNKGFLTEAEDPHFLGDTTILKTVFDPDGNGRPLTSKRKNPSTLADVTTSFGWTPGGRLGSVTPPGKPTHQLGYDTAGFFKTYTPPTLGGVDEITTFVRDSDHQLLTVNTPGWGDLSIRMDPIKGRVTSLSAGGKSIVVDYFGGTGDSSCTAGCAPGRVKQLTDQRSGVATSLQWFNSLPKSVANTLPGTSDIATVAWTYDNDFRIKDETVSVGSTHTSKTTIGFDLDGLPICASLGTCDPGQPERVALNREAASGRVSTVAAGASPIETLSYNEFGELRSLVSAPISLQYEDLASTPNVTRDAQGRVRRQLERIPSTAPPSVRNYLYDEHNRLWKVQDGATSSEYRYDDNGNRTYANNMNGIVGANPGDIVYDAQDRLLKYGDTTFDYTSKGDLWHRVTSGGTTTYDYDAFGALRTVRLPNGNVIEYVVDGRGRRVGKRVNGSLVQQWVYGQRLGPLAELDGAGVIKMRFVYASRPNVPDLVKTYPDGKVYRLYSDQLGSPRILYDIAAGTSKWFGWDEFGIRQAGPSGLEPPFGFAGGLYDPDTKLTRFGARDYDASVGRWVSKDPILFGGRQANLYVYVANNPVNHRDPSGLRRWSNEETDEILRDYREQIQTSTTLEKYWIMYYRHKGGGTYDYWANYEHDTFCVRGQEISSADFGNFIAGYAAGYSADPLAHEAVRWAGQFYGAAGVLLGYGDFSFDQFLWGGDNTRSVLFIEGGAGIGLHDRITE